VWVFTSISGLVTVSSTGDIKAVNDHFSKFFCGYLSSEVIGKVCYPVYTFMLYVYSWVKELLLSAVMCPY